MDSAIWEFVYLPYRAVFHLILAGNHRSFAAGGPGKGQELGKRVKERMEHKIVLSMKASALLTSR